MEVRMNHEKEDFTLFQENVVLKIGMLKNTVERMSVDCFANAYLSNSGFHRLMKFIDEELSKVFESLLRDKKLEIEYRDIARKELEDFIKVKKWEAENKPKVN